MASEATVLREIRAEVADKATEQAQVNAVQKVLARHGSGKLPKIAETTNGFGERVRIFTWAHSPAGDLVLVTGPKLVPDVYVTEGLDERHPGGGVIVKGAETPRAVSRKVEAAMTKGAKRAVRTAGLTPSSRANGGGMQARLRAAVPQLARRLNGKLMYRVEHRDSAGLPASKAFVYRGHDYAEARKAAQRLARLEGMAYIRHPDGTYSQVEAHTDAELDALLAKGSITQYEYDRQRRENPRKKKVRLEPFGTAWDRPKYKTESGDIVQWDESESGAFHDRRAGYVVMRPAASGLWGPVTAPFPTPEEAIAAAPRKNVGLLQPGSGGLSSRTRHKLSHVPGPHEDLSRIRSAERAFAAEQAMDRATLQWMTSPTVDLGAPPHRLNPIPREEYESAIKILRAIDPELAEWAAAHPDLASDLIEKSIRTAATFARARSAAIEDDTAAIMAARHVERPEEPTLLESPYDIEPSPRGPRMLHGDRSELRPLSEDLEYLPEALEQMLPEDDDEVTGELVEFVRPPDQSQEEEYVAAPGGSGDFPEDLAARISAITDPRSRTVLTGPHGMGVVGMTGLEMEYSESPLLPDHIPLRSREDAEFLLNWLNEHYTGDPRAYWKTVILATFNDGSKWRARFDVNGKWRNDYLFGEEHGGGVTWDNTTRKGVIYQNDPDFRDVPELTHESLQRISEGKAAVTADDKAIIAHGVGRELDKAGVRVGTVYKVEGYTDNTDYYNAPHWFRISLEDGTYLYEKRTPHGDPHSAYLTGDRMSWLADEMRNAVPLGETWPGADAMPVSLQKILSDAKLERSAGPENAAIKAVLEEAAPSVKWRTKSSSGTGYGWSSISGEGGSASDRKAGAEMLYYMGLAPRVETAVLNGHGERYHVVIPPEYVQTALSGAIGGTRTPKQVVQGPDVSIDGEQLRPGDLVVFFGASAGQNYVNVAMVEPTWSSSGQPATYVDLRGTWKPVFLGEVLESKEKPGPTPGSTTYYRTTGKSRPHYVITSAVFRRKRSLMWSIPGSGPKGTDMTGGVDDAKDFTFSYLVTRKAAGELIKKYAPEVWNLSSGRVFQFRPGGYSQGAKDTYTLIGGSLEGGLGMSTTGKIRGADLERRAAEDAANFHEAASADIAEYKAQLDAADAAAASGIVIAHSAEDGTTARGDTRPVKETLKRWGFRWYKAGGFWYVPRSRDKDVSPLDLAALRLELGIGSAQDRAEVAADEEAGVPVIDTYGTDAAPVTGHEAGVPGYGPQIEIDGDLYRVARKTKGPAGEVWGAQRYDYESGQWRWDENVGQRTFGLADNLETIRRALLGEPKRASSADETRERFRKAQREFYDSAQAVTTLRGDVLRQPEDKSALNEARKAFSLAERDYEAANDLYLQLANPGDATGTDHDNSRELDRRWREVQDEWNDTEKEFKTHAATKASKDAHSQILGELTRALDHVERELDTFEEKVAKVEDGSMRDASQQGLNDAIRNLERAERYYPSFYDQPYEARSKALIRDRRLDLQNRLTEAANRNRETDLEKGKAATLDALAQFRSKRFPIALSPKVKSVYDLSTKQHRPTLILPVADGTESLILRLEESSVQNHWNAKMTGFLQRAGPYAKAEALFLPGNGNYTIANLDHMTAVLEIFSAEQSWTRIKGDWRDLLRSASHDDNRYGLHGVLIRHPHEGPYAWPPTLSVGGERLAIPPVAIAGTDGSRMLVLFAADKSLPDKFFIPRSVIESSNDGELAIRSLSTKNSSATVSDEGLEAGYEEGPDYVQLLQPFLEDAGNRPTIRMAAADIATVLKIKPERGGLPVIAWTKKAAAFRNAEGEFVRVPALAHLPENGKLNAVAVDARLFLDAMKALEKKNACDIVFTGGPLDPILVLEAEKKSKHVRSISVLMPLRYDGEKEQAELMQIDTQSNRRR